MAEMKIHVSIMESNYMCVYAHVWKMQRIFLPAKGKSKKNLCCAQWACTDICSIMSCSFFPWRAVLKIHK